MKRNIIPAAISMLRRWANDAETAVIYDVNHLSVKRSGLPSVDVWHERKWLVLVKRYMAMDGLGVMRLTKSEYEEILHMFRK